MPRVDPRRFFTPPFVTKRNFLLSLSSRGRALSVRRASRRIKEVLSVAADYTPFRNDDSIQKRQRAAIRKWNERTREKRHKSNLFFFHFNSHLIRRFNKFLSSQRIAIGNIILSDYITVSRRARLGPEATNCLFDGKRNKCAGHYRNIFTVLSII